MADTSNYNSTRCPKCFQKLTQWLHHDPIPTPNGCQYQFNASGMLISISNPINYTYKGFLQVNADVIKELQVNRHQAEINLDITPLTTFTTVESTPAGIYIPNVKHIKELRDSTEKILNATGVSKETYFNYNDDNVECQSPHQLDWIDPILSDKPYLMKDRHIEDLRKYLMTMFWWEPYSGIAPQVLDSFAMSGEIGYDTFPTDSGYPAPIYHNISPDPFYFSTSKHEYRMCGSYSYGDRNTNPPGYSSDTGYASGSYPEYDFAYRPPLPWMPNFTFETDGICELLDDGTETGSCKLHLHLHTDGIRVTNGYAGSCGGAYSIIWSERTAQIKINKPLTHGTRLIIDSVLTGFATNIFTGINADELINEYSSVNSNVGLYAEIIVFFDGIYPAGANTGGGGIMYVASYAPSCQGAPGAWSYRGYPLIRHPLNEGYQPCAMSSTGFNPINQDLYQDYLTLQYYESYPEYFQLKINEIQITCGVSFYATSSYQWNSMFQEPNLEGISWLDWVIDNIRIT